MSHDDPDYFCADCLTLLSLTGCGEPGELECARCGKIIERAEDYVDQTERDRRMDDADKAHAEWVALNRPLP